MITIISYLIGAYIILESIDAASAMDGGDKPCRMAKYLLSGVSGLILILYPSDLLHVVFGLAIAAFTWPKVMKRYKDHVNCRCDVKAPSCMSLKVIRDCPLDHAKCKGE